MKKFSLFLTILAAVILVATGCNKSADTTASQPKSPTDTTHHGSSKDTLTMIAAFDHSGFDSTQFGITNLYLRVDYQHSQYYFPVASWNSKVVIIGDTATMFINHTVDIVVCGAMHARGNEQNSWGIGAKPLIFNYSALPKRVTIISKISS